MKSSAGLKLIKTAENLDNWTKKLTSFQKSFFINILFPVQETYASLKYFFFFSKIFFLLFGGFPKDDILTNVSDIQDMRCFQNMNTSCLKHTIIIDLNDPSLLETDPEFGSQTHLILLLSRCVLEFPNWCVCLNTYTISGLCSAEY